MATPSRRRSLVRRLIVRAALWAAILGLTLVTLAVWQYWRASLRALDARLMDDARTLAGQITVRDDLLDIQLSRELRRTISAAPSYYGVYDRDGRLLDGSAPRPPDGSGPRPPTLRTLDGYREALIPSTHGATVIVGRSLAPVYADVRRLAASLVIASLVVVVLALPLMVWLRRQLAMSIAQIDQTARTLAPGKPARIDAARVDEEFVGVAGTLNAAFDRLEHALARERQFTSDASHELRTPVSTLVAETDWALTRPRDLSEYRQSLEVCARQARRMKDLAESLLTLARIEAAAEAGAVHAMADASDGADGATSAMTSTPVDLRAVADEAVSELLPLAQERQVTLHVDGEASVPGDRVQLRILLSNLLSNAVRYNRPDGDVHVQLERVNGHVRLEVTDTGAGLAPDQVAQVFDRFWRADDARSTKEGGSGLGLAISKAVVNAHGGQITCRSVRQEGTTFTVDLPA